MEMAALGTLAGTGSILPAVLGGVSILGGMMKDKTPAPPPISSPAVMPTPDDERVKQARRRAVAEQMTRQGRESTILTDTAGDKLGG